MAEEYPRIRPVGDCSLLVEFEEDVNPEVNRKVRRLANLIEAQSLPEIIEVVPAYRSLMIFFDPLKADLRTVSEIVQKLSLDSVETELIPPRLFKVPTVYGGSYGPDLVRVSEQAGRPPDEIVHLFSSREYLVYCLGFLCSLAYLGGVPKILEIPRLTSPRPFVPAGSVGFAGRQANILPIDQPSGFNYIGRTFVAVYDPQRMPPTPIRPGDYIRCPSVSEEEAKSAGRRSLEEFIESIQDH